MKKVLLTLIGLFVSGILPIAFVGCGEHESSSKTESSSKMTAIEVCQYVDKRLSESYRYKYSDENPNFRAELHYQSESATQIDDGVWSVQVNVAVEVQRLENGKWIVVKSETITSQYRFDEATAILEEISFEPME